MMYDDRSLFCFASEHCGLLFFFSVRNHVKVVNVPVEICREESVCSLIKAYDSGKMI